MHVHGSVLLCAPKKSTHTHIRLIRTGSPGRPPRTFTQLLYSSDTACGLKSFIATERQKRKEKKMTALVSLPPTHTHTHTQPPPPLPPHSSPLPPPSLLPPHSPVHQTDISSDSTGRSVAPGLPDNAGTKEVPPETSPAPETPSAPAAVTDTSTQTTASPRKLKKTLSHASCSTGPCRDFRQLPPDRRLSLPARRYREE